MGFIGGGNMARAIAGGLVRSGFDTSHILISEPLPEQRAVLAQEFPGAQICESNAEVCGNAGTVVLAVKPQNPSHRLRRRATGSAAAETAGHFDRSRRSR